MDGFAESEKSESESRFGFVKSNKVFNDKDVGSIRRSAKKQASDPF